MKLLYLFIVLVTFALVSCTRSEDHSNKDHDTDQTQEEGPNQALYHQMMDVHDEVMPNMGEIMGLKRKLQEKITSAPDMPAERKQELENVIYMLDSASNSMMSWMHRIHEFNPMADSVDQEKAREYLESEMEEIRNVKELINESIDKARAEAGKN